MNLTDVVPNSWSYTIIPVILIGGFVLGVIFLVVLGILIGRRVSINVKTGGVFALTLASILFLSGIWCVFISPTVTRSETKEDLYRRVSIDGLGSWGYSFDVMEGDRMDGFVDVTRVYDGNITDLEVFSFQILDPENEVAWSDVNVTGTWFNIRASKSGLYKMEIQNVNQPTIICNIQLRVTREVTYRPLEPLGSWLALISLPIFGPGMWASGLLEELKPYIIPPREQREG